MSATVIRRAKTDDIFASKADYLICPINCKGSMGKGLAKLFAWHYPDLEHAYIKACEHREVAPGKIFEWGRGDIQVLGIPTKYTYSSPSKYEYIEKGLKALVEMLQDVDEPTSVALPALGCGLGGLDWGQVEALYQSLLYPELDENITFYEYCPQD